MSEDTLNEKIYDTIFDNLDSFENHISGIEKAANECERIYLSEMINLLKGIAANSCDYSDVVEIIQSLTNKLNSLK